MRKQCFALIMMTSILAGLTGCSNTAGEPETTVQQVTEVEKNETLVAEAQLESDHDFIIATDTTFAPFEFENENGEMVGIDLDLLEAISQDQGFTYTLQVVGFSAAVTALEAGECDGVIAGMSITDEREKKYDFTNPYYDSGVGMAVVTGSGIQSYEGLNGKQVAAKIGTEGCSFAETIADKYGFSVIQFEDSSSMYQDVLAGSSAACFEDYPVLGYEINRGLDFTLPVPMEEGASYGLAVLKDSNSELLEMFNAGLKNLKESGKYDEIINTYISK